MFGVGSGDGRVSCSPLGGGGHPRSPTSSLEAEGRAMKLFLSTAGGNAGREPAEVSRWRGRACMCEGKDGLFLRVRLGVWS